MSSGSCTLTSAQPGREILAQPDAPSRGLDDTFDLATMQRLYKHMVACFETLGSSGGAVDLDVQVVKLPLLDDLPEEGIVILPADAYVAWDIFQLIA